MQKLSCYVLLIFNWLRKPGPALIGENRLPEIPILASQSLDYTSYFSFRPEPFWFFYYQKPAWPVLPHGKVKINGSPSVTATECS